MLAKLTARAAFALAVGLGLAAPATAGDDDPSMLAFNVGALDMFQSDTAFLAGVEWRSDFRKFILTPMVGGLVTGDGALYGYGGVFIDIDIGERFVIRPSVAAGAFTKGDGKDLGGTLEFRTAIEAAYKFEGRSRIGIEFTHLSNAGSYGKNPGTEYLTLNYSIPLGSLF